MGGIRHPRTLVALAALLLSCGGSSAGNPTVPVEADTTSSSTTPAATSVTEPGDTAPGTSPEASGEPPIVRHLSPESGLEELTSVDIIEVLETSDPQVILVSFEAGVEECFGLARVGVEETDGEVAIELVAGRRPPVDTPCIALVQRYATEVELDEPLGDRVVTDLSAPLE